MMESHTKKLRELFWPSVAFTRAILGSLCIHWGMLMVVGLKLENVSIPRSGILGGSVTLGCDYLLDPVEALLSLKWYRDGHEFFRFFPGNRDSPITTFTLPGVHVDLGESMKVQHSRVRFRIKNLDFNSGGTYRCEVSAESSFQTLQNEGNLSIMALPESPKTLLTGFPSIVQFGDRVNGNCTFADTFPAAGLTLYLNDVKINKSDDTEVIHYEPVILGQRQTSIMGIKFRAAPKHFQLGVLHIKCVAKLFDQKWETLKNITHQNYQSPFQTAGQTRYSSGNYCSVFSIPMSRWMLITITLVPVYCVSYY